jgi:hypothetical protein
MLGFLCSLHKEKHSIFTFRGVFFMAKKKTLNYYKELAAKNSRSAAKARDLSKKYIEGVREGIKLAKEANQ